MNRYKILTTPLLVLLSLIAGVTACEKVEDLVRFTFKDTAKITIQSQGIISTGLLKITSPPIQTSSKQAFSQNNTEAKYVKEAKLTELKLTITAPQSQTFSFINSIKIYISASGQEEVLIASKDNIPNDAGKQILLDVANVNLRPYIQQDSYSIRTEAVIDEIPTENVNIDADMSFTVTANVF